MDSHRISNWIVRQDSIDKLAVPMSNWLNDFLDPDKPAVAKMRGFLHGRWLGHPIHPILVHIPVGVWTAAAIMDLFCRHKAAWFAADWAILIGVIMAIPAAIAGLNDWIAYDSMPVRRVGFAHLSLSLLALLLYAISSVFRAGSHVHLALLTGYLGFASLLITGYLGGTMVYQMRVGVNRAEELDESPEGIDSDEFVTVMRLSDLQENKPTRVAVGDSYAVLVRLADRVFALSDRCAHAGGSLSKGRLIGECIQCPLHGTTYRLEDGQVAIGPGVYAQPVFEVYVREDEIRVKPLRVEDPVIASAPIQEQVSVM